MPKNPKTYGVPGIGIGLGRNQGDRNRLFQETGAPGDSASSEQTQGYGEDVGSSGSKAGGTVVMHYKFDEASGNILDYSASDYDLTTTTGVSYEEAVNETGISPGIDTSSGCSRETSAADPTHLDTASGVSWSLNVQMVVNAVAANSIILETDVGNVNGSFQIFLSNATTLRPFIKNDAGSTFFPAITVSDTTDGNVHWWDFWWDESGDTFTVSIDGVVQGTPSDISSHTGSGFSGHDTISIGGTSNNTLLMDGIFAEARFLTGTALATCFDG